MAHTLRNYNMTDYNNAKKYDYDLNDHISMEKIRHKIQDPKWQNYSLGKPTKKTLSQHTKINLRQHEQHDWQPIKGPFGNHAGKIVCNTCGGKWVTWLPKGSI